MCYLEFVFKAQGKCFACADRTPGAPAAEWAAVAACRQNACALPCLLHVCDTAFLTHILHVGE